MTNYEYYGENGEMIDQSHHDWQRIYEEFWEDTIKDIDCE